MLRKVACNATNSGAIDHEGNVYVWGAGKYGLLGNPKQRNPISKPQKLQLKSEKLILDYSSDQTFVATSLAFGQYHAAVVVNDINTNSDFNPLLYAEQILKEFKAFLMKCWESTVKKQPEHQSDVYSTEEHIIEHTLKFCFKDQMTRFPYISIKSLKELMVYQAKLSFKDTVSYNRMFQDLSDPNDEDNINLKELRDQLIGRRCGNGIVFTWGIVNEGRLGIHLSQQELEAIDSKQNELTPYKPSIVKFEGSTIIVKVSCGNSFTLALSQDGLVYSWGLRNSGGLGQGEQSNLSMTPSVIKYQKNGHLFQNIKDIACGSNHVLALDLQGVVYSWGNGQGGRLGHGDETGENIPKEIAALREHKILIIEAGDGSSAAITIKNELYIWGVGLHGRLGTGKTANVLKPLMLEDLKDQKVEDIALGSNHSLCILRNGKAMCWGSSKDGKIGLETALDRNFTQPKELVTLDKEKLYQIGAGPFHTLALTENGEIFSFGNSKDGKLGYEENKGNQQIPRKMVNCPLFARKTGIHDRRDKFQLFNQYNDQMVTLSNNYYMGGCEVLQTCCGFSSTLFLLNDGQMYVCGSNKYGQLGFNKRPGGGKDNDFDKLIGGIGSGRNNKDDDGEGDNDFADGGSDDVLPPQLKKRLAELQLLQDVDKPTPLTIYHDAVQMKIRFVSCGYFHALAVTEEGMTFGWGRNDFGQLGMGRRDNAVAKPTRIKSLQDKFIVMTAAGENHSLFLSDLGEVLSAGFNEFGELGVGLAYAGVVDNKVGDGKGQTLGETQGGGDDLLYDENYQRQLLETKIELTPKVIKGLESIGFIAAGKNHSVAIRTYKRKEKAMRLYTWGCGWHGQTGHGNWQNDYTPSIVKIPVFKDTKFIQASCGSKHTIALDTDGHIWFFGYKPSVGIEDFQEEKQFVPARLETPQKLLQEPFKFIASGEEHNLAITHSGQVLGFGRNMPHTKINSNSREYVYFEQVESDTKALTAACGANHSVMIDNQGVPYTWGYVGNGRCGLKLEKDDAQQEQESLSAPTVIYFMKTLFQKEIIKQKDLQGDKQKASGGGQGANSLQKQGIINLQKGGVGKLAIRFPIQKILKESQQSLDEDNLINQDRNILLKFNRMIEEFHEVISKQTTSLLTSFYNAQNALIARINTFPARIDFLTDIKAELPKAIIRNKQIYEAIFTLLQTHPCYLINWITKTTVNRQPKEVIVILKIIFGEKEIRNDPRIIHILMLLARKIFQFEMETYDLKEILWGRTDSTFSQLFNLIFENQDQNNKFINHLVSSILHKLQKFFLSMTNDSNNQFNIQIKNKAHLHQQFDYESVIQDSTRAQQRIRFLIEFMKICLQKMLKALDPQFKHKSGGSLSSEVVSLVYAVKEEIGRKRGNDVSQEEVDSYVLNLVFEILFKKLHELNYEKVKDLYWPLSRAPAALKVPDKDVFNFSEKRNLLSVLADHLEKYLRKIKIHYTNQPVEVLKEFIATNRQNYRKELSDLLNYQPFNFDYILVKDLFINSMEFRNANLSVSINDLIFIYNSLVEKGEIIYIQSYEEDPIAMLVQELGNAPIEVKQNEKQFISEELLDCKLNLEIRHRLLVDHSTFTRCFDCLAPVYGDMLPAKRFKEGVQGRIWVCQNKECRGERNEANQMKCSRCTRYRETTTLPKDQMFTKYRQLFSDPAVSVFQLLLIYLPVVDVHQNLDEIIDYEVQVEESRKNPDYDKLEIIELFKKHKASYMFQNKKKNVNFEDPQEERAAELEVENEFLDGLENQLERSYQNKKEHEARIKDYYQLLKEIGDKMSNYLQQNAQMREEFKVIIDNVYTGLGSEFLRGEKQDIFAGKLHLKSSKRFAKISAPQMMGAQKKQQLSANPQLEAFFGELEREANQGNAVLQSNYQQLQQNKEIYKQNFGFFGKYPLYQLRQRKVLNNIQIHGKKLATVMKKCSYVFYDDNDNGFRVELVYEESDKSCLVFGSTTHEAILETFAIDKDIVAEMRRTFATKATIQFGNSEFNVFELVFLLNEIKSKTYSYQVKTQK